MNVRSIIDQLRRAMPLNGLIQELDKAYTAETSEHNLYRHFDRDGNLLYIGISINAINRLGQHKNNSDWFCSIARVEIEKLPSREQAMEAERLAIFSEKPLHNKTWIQPQISVNSGKTATLLSCYNPGEACPKCEAWRAANRERTRKWRKDHELWQRESQTRRGTS